MLLRERYISGWASKDCLETGRKAVDRCIKKGWRRPCAAEENGILRWNSNNCRKPSISIGLWRLIFPPALAESGFFVTRNVLSRSFFTVFKIEGQFCCRFEVQNSHWAIGMKAREWSQPPISYSVSYSVNYPVRYAAANPVAQEVPR